MTPCAVVALLLEGFGLGLHDLRKLGKDGLVETKITSDDRWELELQSLKTRVGFSCALNFLRLELEPVGVRALKEERLVSARSSMIY